MKLSVYLDAHDTSHLDDAIATLHRVGSTRALCMVSGLNGWRMDSLRFSFVCTKLRAQGIEPVAVAFPAVNGNHGTAIAHYVACRAFADGGQLDAEPKQIGKDPGGHPVMAHWTPALLKRWLDVDPTMSVTTTRVECPRLGAHDRRLYLQLEQQTSFATLSQALDIAHRDVKPENIVLVSGVFNQPSDPRTVPEVLADCEAARPQAELVGEHAVWSCHTLTPEKCDAVRVAMSQRG